MFHTNAQKQRDNALQQLQSVNTYAFPGESQLDADMNVLVVLQSEDAAEEICRVAVQLMKNPSEYTYYRKSYHTPQPKVL